MSSARIAILVAAAGALACGSKGSSHPGFQVAQGDNVMPVSVAGVHCGSSPYVNEPCVAVTVCQPGTTSCVTVENVLLDTGSFGLRLFAQALGGLSLPPVTVGQGEVATCVQFADGTSDWGPVRMADVKLANEPPVTVPIHVIDATFGTVPSSCTTPETGPSAQNGMSNGILGIGAFVEDCGPACADTTNPQNLGAGLYYAVNGSQTVGAAVPLASQVQNPAALLPTDGNGLIVALPSVPASGATSVEGWLVLGIGTRSNNAVASATAMALDGSGAFTTTVSGGAAQGGSFADTGSNGLFFDAPTAIAPCAAPDQGWYCPASPLSFSARNEPSAGLPGAPVTVPFQIANVEALSSRGAVFSNVGGGSVQGAGFDWGLPFYLGRTVYLGFYGRTSPLGTGPAIAY